MTNLDICGRMVRIRQWTFNFSVCFVEAFTGVELVFTLIFQTTIFKTEELRYVDVFVFQEKVKVVVGI